MAEPKHEETFKVVDRRLFSEDGQLRKDVAEQQERELESAKKVAAATALQQKGAKQPNQTVATPSVPQTLEAPPAEDAIQPSRNFQMLVDFLTRNAAAMLGGMADPRTGQAYLDLEGSREMIDMLDGLRDKTQGNLAKADEDLLIEVIGSLKLTFMEVSKAASEAMNKKAKAKP